MKTRLLIITVSLTAVLSCTTTPDEHAFLTKASDRLSEIKSATYYSTGTGSAPGDTTKFSAPNTQYIKIFINPSDTLVGSASVQYDIEDTSRITDFYDCKVRGTFNWEKKTVKIDSFKNDPYPFRLVYYPFYTKINEIIKYSLTTSDSIETRFEVIQDTVHFRLKIFNQHVYFHIKPIVIRNEYIPDDEVSQFDIWFSKNDYYPFRMRSKWSHATSWEECSDPHFNTARDTAFISTDYFPDDFEIIQFVRGEQKPSVNMEGRKAPDWTLYDLDSIPVTLSALKSRVLMIQFTGVGCGPCHHSLPFLRQLVSDYSDKDFEFISIETWSNNIEGLKSYRDKNNMNYKFLNADKKIQKDYEVNSVPVFFILDKERIIRKELHGYGKETTDQIIRETIDNLL